MSECQRYECKKIPYGYGIEQNNTITSSDTVTDSDTDTDTVTNTVLSEKDVNGIFERLWKLYPNKRGKGRVSDARKRKVAEIGEAEMQRAIDRYIDDLQKNTWRKVQNGSTADVSSKCIR